MPEDFSKHFLFKLQVYVESWSFRYLMKKRPLLEPVREALRDLFLKDFAAKKDEFLVKTLVFLKHTSCNHV